ncbi:hypothetical protein PILCRDRAFT_829278 [Piloderma croceum F 1598]|uniref:Uncharacterized protein n=1 Tax=Piloderma croceum (strain F 1598) TaxID=765440 RepID=A0A0C3EZ99_PILCF|nr:hypothetical protein PILCRDRAFT_829278 [Piloderma croceum F 1598]
MLQPGGVKIWRPRQVKWLSVHVVVSFFVTRATQIYVGEGKRDYVPVDKRIAVNGDRYVAPMLSM